MKILSVLSLLIIFSCEKEKSKVVTVNNSLIIEVPGTLKKLGDSTFIGWSKLGNPIYGKITNIK